MATGHLKLFFSIAIALAAVTVIMAGCAAGGDPSSQTEPLEGQELIESAMRNYNGQDSGGYEAVDNLTGTLMERFVYRYDEVDFLIYLSERTDEDGRFVREYNSGYDVFVEEDGVGRRLSRNDDDFKLYHRDAEKYSKASDAVFGFVTAGVERVEKSAGENGCTDYTYIYDAEEAGVGIDGGRLDSYSITYTTDKNGDVLSLRQQADGFMDGGESFQYDYTITFIPSEQVGLIGNPITVEEAQEDESGSSSQEQQQE